MAKGFADKVVKEGTDEDLFFRALDTLVSMLNAFALMPQSTTSLRGHLRFIDRWLLGKVDWK